MILRLLEGASPGDLNEVLADQDLARSLVSSLNDRPFGGPDNRAALFELLGSGRRGELGIPARAGLIRAIQERRLGPREERLVRDLITELHGGDLTALKNLVDAGADHDDLEKLVFRDVGSAVLRQEILAHIAVEAKAVRVDAERVGAAGTEAKVLSDIDDTAICTLKDTRFPKGTLYPGVLALWKALDEGPTGTGRTIGDLTFITARPTDVMGIIEDLTRSRLRAAGIGHGAILTGSFVSLLSHGGMADRKLRNIAHYHQLFPEYRIVFIGDSGQGDVRVATRLRTQLGGAVDAALIHDVVGTPPEERLRHAADGVEFFDTYAQAAVVVRRLGLISDNALDAVVDETIAGFDRVPWASREQESRARALLSADLELVSAARANR